MTRVALAKALLGGAGLVTGLVGMMLDVVWVVGIGAGLLAVAFLLRFAPGRSPASAPGAPDA